MFYCSNGKPLKRPRHLLDIENDEHQEVQVPDACDISMLADCRVKLCSSDNNAEEIKAVQAGIPSEIFREGTTNARTSIDFQRFFAGYVSSRATSLKRLEISLNMGKNCTCHF